MPFFETVKSDIEKVKNIDYESSYFYKSGQRKMKINEQKLTYLINCVFTQRFSSMSLFERANFFLFFGDDVS